MGAVGKFDLLYTFRQGPDLYYVARSRSLLDAVVRFKLENVATRRDSNHFLTY